VMTLDQSDLAIEMKIERDAARERDILLPIVQKLVRAYGPGGTLSRRMWKQAERALRLTGYPKTSAGERKAR
jgi:hypothetical protein